ncbi:hypothetical protein QWY99_06210 [Flavobacterium branchiarum]|nr:hypothetical protein [Flavobacterium branchiarum]MDN3672647.1 hypothetical protein [Flavobacterium branchiarum]
MKTVIKKLNITQDQYESMIWNFYNNWCESVSITTLEYQQVLANSSINSWFRMELTNCEIEFHKLTDRYTQTSVTARDLEKCYHDCLMYLFNYRPMSLLSQIKRSKTPQGVKVFSTN